VKRGRTADPYRDLDVIDGRGPRFNQATIGLLAVVSVLTGWWPLLAILALAPATETRRTPLDDAWQLAAYGRYRREAQPERRADVVVRVDHPDRPALLLR